ncbi:hypothetical protein WBG83_09360 [Paenibacillus sp. y28]
MQRNTARREQRAMRDDPPSVLMLPEESWRGELSARLVSAVIELKFRRGLTATVLNSSCYCGRRQFSVVFCRSFAKEVFTNLIGLWYDILYTPLGFIPYFILLRQLRPKFISVSSLSFVEFFIINDKLFFAMHLYINKYVINMN